jgi:hypothetical protein
VRKKKRDRKNRRKRQQERLQQQTGPVGNSLFGPGGPAMAPLWQEDDGCHTILPGPLSPKEVERASKAYQEAIRDSPLWDLMVAEFGLAKAEELLKQCRLEIRR